VVLDPTSPNITAATSAYRSAGADSDPAHLIAIVEAGERPIGLSPARPTSVDWAAIFAAS
jgi:hypothetical protein